MRQLSRNLNWLKEITSSLPPHQNTVHAGTVHVFIHICMQLKIDLQDQFGHLSTVSAITHATFK